MVCEIVQFSHVCSWMMNHPLQRIRSDTIPTKHPIRTGTQNVQHYLRYEQNSLNTRRLKPSIAISQVLKHKNVYVKTMGIVLTLFYYNGHGVLKPTNHGELWCFNSNYTEYLAMIRQKQSSKKNNNNNNGGNNNGESDDDVYTTIQHKNIVCIM